MSELLTQLREASRYARGRVNTGLRAQAVLFALESSADERRSSRVTVTVVTPPMETLDMQSHNWRVYVGFEGERGGQQYLQTSREMLTHNLPMRREPIRVEDVVFDAALHIRNETTWERQSRLVREIQEQDSRLTKDLKPKKRAWEKRLKYKKVYAFLQASDAIEREYAHLSDLFDWEESGENVELYMRETHEKNFAKRLRKRSLPPILEANDTSFTTQLNRGDLFAKKERFEGGSQMEDDRIGYEICLLLNERLPAGAQPL